MSLIYLRDGERFVAMHEQRYEAEPVLQALIAEHPELLAGDESGTQTAWLLVKEQAGIAIAPEGADHFALDHVFLDAEGVPTLVEVKRSQDSRARRLVVAQMLDYAANASAHWSVERLRGWFEAECALQERLPEEHLAASLGVSDAEEFWETVKTNLAAERIRLVFVADEIPAELRAIVEYLNRQMRETEVFAIEVKQYVDAAGEQQTIVPRIIGRTEAAKAAKSAGGGRPTRIWDQPSLLAAIHERHGASAESAAAALISWGAGRPDVRVDYGRGAVDGSAQFKLVQDGKVLLNAFHIWTYGSVAIPFSYMGAQEPFASSRASRDELRERINEALPASSVPSEEARPEPSFPLLELADDTARESFLAAIEWAMEQARTAQTPAEG